MVPLVLRRLLESFVRATRPARRRGRHQTRRDVRPRLEVLEDRTVPSTVIWIDGSGDWSNNTSWLDTTTQTHHTPTAADNAVIDVAGLTITHSTGSDTVHSLVSNDGFVLSGGTLSLTTASTIDNSFTMSAGTLSGAGNLTVNGLLTWTSGTMTGAGHTVAQ